MWVPQSFQTFQISPNECRMFPIVSVTCVSQRNFPNFHFYPGWTWEFSPIFISTPGTRVEIESTPRVWWQTTFRECCFHHNPVTITFLPRVNRFNVLSHLCFWSCRSLFNLTRRKNNKKTQRTSVRREHGSDETACRKEHRWESPTRTLQNETRS